MLICWMWDSKNAFINPRPLQSFGGRRAKVILMLKYFPNDWP